jgi:hypothetical protein
VKAHRAAIIIAAAVATGYAAYRTATPTNPGISTPRLQIVRRAVERDREVIFFRVVLPDTRRVQICWAEKVIGDRVEIPYVEDMFPAQLTPNFWAPSQVWPMGDFKKGRKEFGVTVPTNTAAWKFRVRVNLSVPRSRAWWKMMRWDWADQRSRGISVFKAVNDTWNTFYSMETQEIESETITNNFPVLGH